NESSAIITSMNLYEFSQINNNEMGVFIERDVEPELYSDTYEEAQRLIRISEEVRLAAETIEKAAGEPAADPVPETADDEKLTTSRLARERNLKTNELLDKLVGAGLLENDGTKHSLTEAGKSAGGEFRFSKKYGPYF